MHFVLGTIVTTHKGKKDEKKDKHTKNNEITVYKEV